jgi:type IV secretion/conjugal transfer VirB4 family ATPase
VFKLDQIGKDYREAGALCSAVNLFGFVDDQAFLTKSGDVGLVLAIEGVDYECLDATTVDNLSGRLTAAFRVFDEKCRVYQYLFKRNQEHIPHETYANPVVNAAIQNRIAYLEHKASSLYAARICYVVLFEGFRYQASLLKSLAKLTSRPVEAARELQALLSGSQQTVVIGGELEHSLAALHAKVRSFIGQVSDFVAVRTLPKDEAFRMLKQILNFSPLKLENARLRHDTFLDYYLAESHLECHSGFLRVDDYYVKVLTLKEPSAQTFPLILKGLLEVEASYFLCSEWQKQDPAKSRALIHSRRRHFHNTKRSLASYAASSEAPERADEVLIDESKEAQVRDLGQALTELEIKGNYFGTYSLTVVVYDRDLAKVEAACADFYKVFTMHDAQLYEEKYNLFNAYMATVPGNYAFNLRSMLILNTNYADYAFLFTLNSGHQVNGHLRQEYLAVLETNHRTPYYLNLHCKDTAHTVILGRTGSGKSFLLNFLITNLQKYDPYTFIFDLGGSFENLTRLFGGTYVKVGRSGGDFKINPFCLPKTKANLDFLALFVEVLASHHGTDKLSGEDQRELYEQIDNLYSVEPELRTLGVLVNMLPRGLSLKLQKWTAGGQFGFLFDNAEDTVSFSRFQCFDFQGMEQYPQILEPLLFYILHRANHIITDREITHIFKAFFIDEAWTFFRNPRIKSYIVEALKTWRKQNAAMILSTQSLDELRKSDIIDVIIETCATKIFLANPDMDRELYRDQFHLSETEIERVSSLIPKRQFLIKNHEIAKIANLEVDAKSYWLYTNDPFDNRKRAEAFAKYGFVEGLEVLARAQASEAAGKE